ncbi:MAG: IS66 family insertion sequence element accessory protein TnpB [bacterium]|nr:IS66 family insertion sequence element accessory protein TnpB [bacterium]
MLSPPSSLRVFVATGVTDLRKSFDGLSAATRQVLGRSPTSGEVFLFCNRRRNRVKALWWDGHGLWCAVKRLERGTFAWPQAGTSPRSLELCAAEMAALLGGLDLAGSSRRDWYERRPRDAA